MQAATLHSERGTASTTVWYGLTWACPSCRRPLQTEEASKGVQSCPECRASYPCRDQIWRFLPPVRAAAHATFLERYDTVRRSEGWGRNDDRYYRSLPSVPSDDPNRHIWKIRERTYRSFLHKVLAPLETGGTLRTIDLGAGNGWLSYRLARRGHDAVAVDIRTGDLDGLGAHRRYDARFTPVEAEFERLPFGSDSFDLAVFNASLHYARDSLLAVQEALRVLRPGGRLVVLDSPYYRMEAAGGSMVDDRRCAFEERFGFETAAVDSEHFLTAERLEKLANKTGLSWETARPHYGMSRALRSIKAKLLGRRPPAQFPMITTEKPGTRTAGSRNGSTYKTLEPRAAYDRWAASYGSRANRLQELEEDAVVRLAPELRDMNVLDLGCGTGRLSELALERGASSTVGVDLSPAMIAKARSRVGGRSDWLVADASELPFEPSTFDVVLSGMALGHVECLADALAAIDRVLKPGGRVLISDFHPFASLSGHERTFEDRNNGRTYAVTHHVHLFQDYVDAFQRYNWHIEAFDEPTHETFPVVFVLRARKNESG